MKLLLWVFPVLLTLSPLRSAAQKTLSTDTLLTRMLQPADMQSDFRYFRRLLEETHPGLYRYVPKAGMQAKLDSIDRTLTQPMPFYTFFGVVAALIGDIRCAHTHALPSKNWREQFNSTLKTIPFYMFPASQRSYVLLNGTSDPAIQPGFELIAINGQSLESIRQRLYRYYWTDGYIESARMATLKGELFALFYYWFIDQPNTFALTFRSLTGDAVRFSAPGQPFAATLKTMKQNPVNRQMVAWHVQK
ncbi:MAG: peptidase S41, partial [Cytophagaceae bacterium]